MTKSTKAGSRRGRPTRRKASKQALAGVDVAALDPVLTLREIAADKSAPATARVAACRALLVVDRAPVAPVVPEDDDAAQTGATAVTRRALRLLEGGRSA